MNRNDMLTDCPEEFYDKLCEILDDIESRVKDIRDDLDIKHITDIAFIESAYYESVKLAKDLY